MYTNYQLAFVIKMYKPLLKVFAFIFLIHLTFQAFCPAGDLHVQKFDLLSANALKHSSQFYDVMYEIKTQNDQSIQLIAYRLKRVEGQASDSFNVQQFRTSALTTWSIQYISENGNCVVIDQGQTLVAYQTSTSVFKLTQTLQVPQFVSIKSNQDCSVIRVKTSDSEKVYQNSIVNATMQFASNSIFDAYLIYGIDNLKKLYKYDSNNFQQITLESGLLQDTPLYIQNRKQMKMLILGSKSATSGDYILTIVNTINDQKLYTKKWLKSQYTEPFQLQLDNEASFILARDKQGYKHVLKISLTSQVPTVTQITLEDAQYNPYFDQDSIISLNKDVIISYFDKTLNYFQTFKNVLYFIGSIVADLQTSTDSFYDVTSSQTVQIIPTLVGPEQLSVCYPSVSTNTSQQSIANKLQDATVVTIKDDSGNQVKCQPQCLVCKLGGLCDVCSLGYIVNSQGQCVYCGGCRSCKPQKPQVCLGCFAPQILDPTKYKCVDPTCTDVNCQSCFLNGTCQKCYSTYSLFKGVCTKCADGCSTCSSDPNICDKGTCQLGYVFYQNPEISSKSYCIQCATGCMGCSIADITDCTKCNEGFFGVKDTTTGALRCSPCMNNCRSCKNATNCERCVTGFKLNQNSTKCVENCDDSCKTCADNDKFYCLTCYAGSDPSGGKCIANLSCNAAKSCKTCGDGYALQDGVCVQCTYTDEKCIACSSTSLSTCLKCQYGYYLSNQRKCVKCLSSCVGCLNQNACFSCSKGFYLSKIGDSVTGTCLACDKQCATCNQFGYLCTSCPQGYTLDGTKCLSNNNVEFSVQISASKSQFVIIARQFVQALLDAANKYITEDMKPLTAKDIILRQLKDGSSIISGAISSSTQGATQNLANNLGAQIAATPIQGVTLKPIGINAVKINTNTDPNTDPNNNKNNNNNNNDNNSSAGSSGNSNLPIILGVIIPLGILFIVGLIILIVKIAQKYKALQQQKQVKIKDSIQSMNANMNNEAVDYI